MEENRTQQVLHKMVNVMQLVLLSSQQKGDKKKKLLTGLTNMTLLYIDSELELSRSIHSS